MSDELKPTVPLGKGAQQVGPALKLGQRSQMAAAAAKGEMALPRLFNQLVVFILDGSNSMLGEGATGNTKGEELHDAVVQVLDRLRQSRNKNCFDISCWVYSSDHKQVLRPTPITDERVMGMSFDPTKHIKSKGTKVSAALEGAFDEARSYLDEHSGKQTKVLFLLLSDGGLHDTPKALKLVETIRTTTGMILATIFFESEVPDMIRGWVNEETGEPVPGEPMSGETYNQRGADTMRKMSSDEKDHFTSTVDPEKIRNQMIKSISKVSQV